MGISVSVWVGVCVGVRVSVGNGEGLSVAEGLGERVCVAVDTGVTWVEVLGGSILAGNLFAGRLQARMTSHKTKITEIRFMARS